MKVDARTVEFELTVAMTAQEVRMLEYLLSVGAQHLKTFAGDRFTLKEWGAFHDGVHPELSRMIDRMHQTVMVWRGEKVAANR